MVSEESTAGGEPDPVEDVITDAGQWTEDAEGAAESTSPEDAAPDDASPDEPAAAPEDLPPSGWAALDEYARALRAEHAEWAERLGAVRGQLATAAVLLGQLERGYHDLGVEEDIALLREHVLGGAGAIQRLRFDFDLERYVALAWPAPADPRPDLAGAHAGGEYMVSIWFGMGEDGRGRVRVEGEKRLEAPLSTTRERLRGVLLRAMQAPRWIARPGEDEGPASEEEDEMGRRQPDEEAESPHAEGASERGAPEDLPAEEMVIPLGPAGDESDEEDEDGAAR